MTTFTMSPRIPATAQQDVVVPAGDGWTQVIPRGHVLRIVDLEGNQAVDTMFYDAHDPSERYCAATTLRKQQRVYLSTGTQLMSSLGRPLMSIIADTCGRHDTLGGACAAESNAVRYSHDKIHMHSCRDTFLLIKGESMKIPFGQRLADSPFTLLIAGLVVMFIFYTIAG